jgi:hypothetical protein
MTIPSPYLDSNPTLALLSRGVGRPCLPDGRVTYELFCWSKGKIVWKSGKLDKFQFPNTPAVLFGNQPNNFKWQLCLTRCYRGYPVSSCVPIQFPSQRLEKSGRVKFPVNEHSGAIPSGIKDAIRRVDGRIKSTVVKVKVPRSSDLRPSPESYLSPFTAITEGNNGGYFFTATPRSFQKYRRTWSGVRTPGFAITRKSQLPVNPHSVRITELQDGPLVEKSLVESTGIYFNQVDLLTLHYSGPVELPGHLPEAQFKALRRLIDKMNSGIEANLAQDLVQYGQTVKLIGNTAKRLTKSYTALKSGNIPGAVKELWSGHHPSYNGKGPSVGKSTASNWLELQYGWKPLLQDIHGAMQSLETLSSQWLVHRTTASAQVDLLTESDVPYHINPALVGGKQYLYTVTGCKYVVRWKIADPLEAFLAQTGFTNPVNLAWEILPLSFVVDWFSPIGPFLETLSSWDGLQFVDGSFVLHTREVATLNVNFSGVVFGVLHDDHGVWNRQTVAVDRAKLIAFPGSYLPSVPKNGLKSVTHALNALAIMRTSFR